jgi:hypothetical protein
MRQSAQWGRHAMQPSFPRLNHTLPYEEYREWKRSMTIIVVVQSVGSFSWD